MARGYLDDFTIGSVIRRSTGAYLVVLDDLDGDATPMDSFDAASSLVLGKRIVRQHARDCRDAYRGPFTWVERAPGIHDLLGRRIITVADPD
jgi:hypothetical protein